MQEMSPYRAWVKCKLLPPHDFTAQDRLPISGLFLVGVPRVFSSRANFA
jgi:hypothetical protein